MNITKALADENRVRVLMALHQGELCVCQITELLGLASSTISKHLSILFQAGLLESRKEGRWIFYQLPGSNAPLEVSEVIEWVIQSLKEHPRILEDQRNLKTILRVDPSELCKRAC